MRCRLLEAATVLPGTDRHSKSQGIQIINFLDLTLDNAMVVEGNSILMVWPFDSEHERLKQQRYRTREQCHGPIERHKQSTEIR
jgi:hypothetical protein